ncbi:Mrm1 protein [Martiniozyma asiatica (nom. inval.)]|nr:Mrm1 protein [Martiniozyma asiatica]
MLRSLRRYSIKAPFPTNTTGKGPAAFDKNMPSNVPLKAWERDGESKDHWFKRKHAHHHALQKERGKNDRRDFRKKKDEKPKDLKKLLHTLKPSPLVDYIYGTNSVLAALQSNKREFGSLNIHIPVTVSSTQLSTMGKYKEIKNLAKSMGIEIKEASKQDLNQLTNNGVHNGVVLESRKLDVPVIRKLGEEFTQEMFTYVNSANDYQSVYVDNKSVKGKKRFPLALYLDELTDPHNVGAIMRTAYFMGVDMIFLSERNCAPLGPVVDKVSAGAMEFMEIGYVNKPLDFVSKSSENGWAVFATDMPGTLNKKTSDVESFTIDDVKNTLNEKPTLLLIGSEGEGLRKTLIQRSDGTVGIYGGRKGMVDSLNVSVATGMILGLLLN